jgi:hypothetical protein
LALNASKQAVSVTNTGTGNNVLSASPTLTGTIDAAAQTLSGNLTLNGGTANGVLYLNGSKVATSGTALVFDGTNLGIGTSSPGYKLTVQSAIDTYAFNIRDTIGNERVLIGSRSTAPIDNITPVQMGNDNTGNLFLSSRTNTACGINFYTSAGTTASLRATLDSSGNLGIGTSSPSSRLEVLNGGDSIVTITGNTASGNFASVDFKRNTGTVNAAVRSQSVGGNDIGEMYFMTRPSAGSLTERMRLDSSGNLGLGVTPSAWSVVGPALQVLNATFYGYANQARITANAYFNGSDFKYIASAAACEYRQTGGQHQWFNAASGTAGNTISFTQAMTLDASGNLLVGTTSALVSAAGRGNITVNGSTDSILSFGSAGSNTGYLYATTSGMELTSVGSTYVRFSTNGSERARITSGGIFAVGVTNPTGSSADAVGIQLTNSNYIQINRSGGALIIANRRDSDGTLISLQQDNNEEGTISVSGNTVSYNAFAGSHWSQLQDGSKPDILRGTVMESINELCVWPDESNERLPKSKVSDTAGSKKVYGVFMAWDNDWTTTNDMYVTAVGAFICRVNASVTVQEGDLLESNGDGTARVQADDIIRSSTIGKVTSTVKTHQYGDGSYCVPTVLYCG